MKNYKSYILIVWGILFYISLLAQPSYRPIFEIREKLFKDNLTKQQKCELYILLAYRYISTQKKDSAKYFYNLFEKTNCEVKGKYLGYKYGYLGLKNSHVANYIESINYLRKAGKIFFRENNLNDYYLNLIDQGTVFNRLDSSQKAIEITLKARDYFKSNKHILSRIYLDLGDYYSNLSQYDSAINYLYEAYQLKLQLKDTFGLDILSTNLFDCYFNLEDYSKAKKFALLNVYYAKKIEDTYGIALGYLSLAHLFSVNKQADSAIYYYKRAKNLFYKVKMRYYYVTAFSELGREYFDKKQTNLAIEKLDSALYLAKSYNFNSNLALIYQNLADVYFSVKNYSKAIFYFKKAETYYKKLNYLNNRIKNLYGIAESYKELGKYDSAYLYIRQAFKLKDSLFNQQKLNAIKEAEAKFQNHKLKLENKIKEQKLTAERRQKKLIILIFSVSLLILLISFQFWFYYYKSKRNKELLKLLIQSEEQVKREISSTLHNEVGGKLAAVIFKLQEKNNNLNSEIKALKEIYEIIRSKSHILSIPSFIQTSIEDELENLAAIYQTNNVNINIDIYSKRGWKDVHPFIQQNIYRIVQELLTNSLKHSMADTIDLQIVRDGKQIIIMFNDNGIGYELESIKYGHGFKNEIIDRVKILNAEFVDNTRKGKGVDIIIKIKTSNVNYSF